MTPKELVDRVLKTAPGSVIRLEDVDLNWAEEYLGQAGYGFIIERRLWPSGEPHLVRSETKRSTPLEAADEQRLKQYAEILQNDRDFRRSASANPKHTAGLSKPPLHFIPPAALFAVGKVMQHGAAKYGPFNWTSSGVVASIYFDAMQRHLCAWLTGEDCDPESGQHHLAHVMACCAIVLDCTLLNNLEDDRPKGTAPIFSRTEPQQ